MKKILLATAVAAATLLSACQKGSQPTNLKTDADSLSYELGMSNSASEEQLSMYLQQVGSDSTYVNELIKGLRDGLSAGDDKKQLAYYMGIQVGLNMKRQLTQLEGEVMADSTEHLSNRHFLAGFMAGMQKDSAYTVDGKKMDLMTLRETLNKRIAAMTAKANKAKFGKAQKESEDFIARVAKESGVKKQGGIYYKEITPGAGATPTDTSTVEVKYEGKLVNGTVFDSNYEQPNPMTLKCNQVIKGWTEALTHMPEGSEWEVYIPWELAYGDRATGPIPPYSALIFKIKLVKVH